MGPDGRVMRYWHGGSNGCEVEAEAGGSHVCIYRELSLFLFLSLSAGVRAR